VGGGAEARSGREEEVCKMFYFVEVERFFSSLSFPLFLFSFS